MAAVRNPDVELVSRRNDMRGDMAVTPLHLFRTSMPFAARSASVPGDSGTSTGTKSIGLPASTSSFAKTLGWPHTYPFPIGPGKIMGANGFELG